MAVRGWVLASHHLRRAVLGWGLVVGVRDRPQFMCEYLEAAPDEGDAGFVPELYNGIEEFIRGGRFVPVWCGKEYRMSREGEVADTQQAEPAAAADRRPAS